MPQDLDQSPAIPFDILTEGPTIGPVRNYNPATGGNPGGTNGQVQYNNAGSFGGYTNIQLTALIQPFTTTLNGSVPNPSSSTGKFLRDDATWAAPSTTIPDGNKGDITTSGGGTTWTINALAVTYAKMQNVSIGPAFLGRSSSGAGVIQEMTGAVATPLLSTFTNTTVGILPTPSPSGGNTKFFREDGTWQVPPGGGTGAPPGGATNTVQYNAGGGVFGGMTGTAWNDTTGSLTMTGAIVTASNPTFNRTQTWNNGAVTFDSELVNITDTASAAGSFLDRRQVGSVDKWAVRKDGTLVTGLIPATTGGTGQTSYTIGDILYASSSTALSKLSDVATGNALISGGVGLAPSWGKINLGTAVAGNLPTTNLNSGTGASSTTAWFGDGTWKNALSGPTSTVKGAPPVWSTTTGGVVVDGTGFINVRAYNVLPGNAANTNDTNIATALAALSGGGTLYIPAGTYSFSATITVTGSNITVLGDGPNTILNQTTLSVDAVANQGSNNRFTNFQIKYPSLASAGYGFNASGSGTLFSNIIDNIHIVNAQNAFHSHNENVSYYTNVFASGIGNVGFYFDSTSNVVLNTFDFSESSTNYHSSGVGLFIQGPSQGLQIMNGELFQWNRTLSVGSGSGIATNPAFCNFTSIFFNDGWQADLINSAYDLQFTQCEWSNGAIAGGDNGLSIAGGDLIKFDNCDWVVCGAHGCLVQPGVTNTAFVGCSFISNSQLAGSAQRSGLVFGAGVTDFIVKGCIAKNDTNISSTANQQYGILVSAGASNRYIIEGNLITSNVTGGVNDGGTGLSKQVANNF